MARIAGYLGGVALAVLAPLAAAAETTADTVVATVNGTEITLGHMIAMRENLPEQYQQLPDDALWNGILEQLIQQTALQQAAEPGLTRRDLLNLDNQRRAYVAGASLQAVVAGAVTDAAIEAAYAARVASLAATPASEYNASHILVATEDAAAALRAELDGGADFAELAKLNSTDGSAASGGELGWFGPGMMVKPFEDAVVAMQPGEIAGPVQTQFGWHLIRLNETRAAALPPLDQMRGELAAALEREAVEGYVTARTEAAEVARADGIDPALLRDQSLLDD
jgi:peptidyl-prolyl cis-trans isomerase C